MMLVKDLSPLEEFDAENARFSFKQFVTMAWPVIEPGRPFTPGWHLEAIAEHLEAVSRGNITRLLVNMPPRHGKSSLISVLWSVWLLLNNPATRLLCGSYAMNLATRDNLKTRRAIKSPWFQSRYGWRLHLTKDQDAKTKFETSQLGYRMATSVGSSTTGEGGDILILDDAHNIDEKESDAKREAAIDWFDNTWSTRLNDQQTGAMVVVGHRIHSQDVSGHILELGGWEHLNLPAEFEASSRCSTTLGWEDPRKEEGELLWKARFNESILTRFKKQLGSMGYAGLFQQRPVPAGGGQFKKQWFRYFTTENDYYQLETDTGIKRFLIKNCWLFMTEDLAISTKQTADYTVMCIWAVTPDRDLLLIGRLRDRLDNPAQQQQSSVLYQRYRPSFIKIETVAYQLALVQQLRRQGLPVKEYKPVKDKVARATTAAVYYESSKVFHPKQASWLHEWEDELLLFPLGANDDQVDNASMACEELGMPRSVGGMVVDKQTEEEKEKQQYEEEDELAWR